MELTSTGPWSDIIMRSFFVASSSTSEKPFYGSWNRLLNTMFPVDTIFEVVPQCFPPTISAHDSVDFVILLLISVDLSPVFIVEVKQPSEFTRNSKRQEADSQMRQRFLDIASELLIPVLHGVSVYGTKMAFYKYNKGANVIEPRRITPNVETLTDTAPREWWCWDILEVEGAAKFRQIIEDVKTMCSELE
ncbi:hypothetical protein BU17DRAFT_35918 [Hysterangium stoloniferum]|nr:hypothetical protein BU17DRAFT_35918 [Hysterangium stoloniferum]